MLIRGLIQVNIATLQENLRNSLADRLRKDLFTKVLNASSDKLKNEGRAELLGLLIVDINRSVNALDQSIRSITS